MALAFAREGADVLIGYFSYDAANETMRAVEEAGRVGIALAGDIRDEAHCRASVDRTVGQFGKIDILINNAACEMNRGGLEQISTAEFERASKTKAYALFWLCRAAEPHMPAGGGINNTASSNADTPKPTLLP